jgi:glucose-1-phosphate thymidylyltransferase
VDAAGYLTGIVEKPAIERQPDALISMNCWRFDSRIFQVCRDVPRSTRGEFELPEAVGLAVRRGMKLRALEARGPVLDLSRRADAATLSAHLQGIDPRP